MSTTTRVFAEGDLISVRGRGFGIVSAVSQPLPGGEFDMAFVCFADQAAWIGTGDLVSSATVIGRACQRKECRFCSGDFLPSPEPIWQPDPLWTIKAESRFCDECRQELGVCGLGPTVPGGVHCAVCWLDFLNDHQVAPRHCDSCSGITGYLPKQEVSA